MELLVFVSGVQQGQRVPLSGDRLTLGRGDKNSVRVEDEAASRNHAEVVRENGGLVLRDLQSTNGTFLNDRRVDGDMNLRPGDRIAIGGTTLLVQSDEASKTLSSVIFRDEETADLSEKVSLDASGSSIVAAEAEVGLNFETVYAFMLEIASVLDLDQLLNRVMDHLLDAIPADRGFIMLVDRQGELKPSVIRTRSEDLPIDEISVSRSMTQYVLSRGESVLTSIGGGDGRFDRSVAITKNNVSSVMCAPLRVQDKVLGIIYLDTINPTQPMTKSHLRLLTAMAIQTGVAVENAKLYGELMNAIEYTNSILRSLASGIIVTDAEGYVGKSNAAACDILQVKDGDFLGRNLDEFRSLRPISALMKKTARDNKPLERKEVVVTVAAKDIPLGVSTTPLVNYEGQVVGVIANFRNLELIKQLSKQVQMGQHLAALGEMAAGVAHEIRNPLNTIRGFSQLVAERSNDPSLSEYTGIIVEEVDRMNRIVTELLDFSRQKELTMSAVRINALIEDVLVELEMELQQANVRLLGELAPGLKRVLANASKLKQVLTNIIKNAVQAMTGGGVLKVSTMKLPGPLGVEELAVRIEDNGIGIDSRVIGKVFDPFFTHGKDEGTGLGLAICRKIIEKHGGRIEVESALGEGTVFTLFLPYGPPSEDTDLQRAHASTDGS